MCDLAVFCGRLSASIDGLRMGNGRGPFFPFPDLLCAAPLPPLQRFLHKKPPEPTPGRQRAIACSAYLLTVLVQHAVRTGHRAAAGVVIPQTFFAYIIPLLHRSLECYARQTAAIIERTFA